MKKFSLSSLLSALVLAFAIMWLISTKAFAATDADYLAFTPNGCSSTSMTVFHVSSWDIINGASLWVNNTIYVIDDVPTAINGNISIDNDCVALVANGNASGNTLLNFAGGKYLYSNRNAIRIAWFDTTHRLEIAWATSPAGIIVENGSWITISNTTISWFTMLWGIVFSNTNNSTITNNTLSNNIYGLNILWTNNTITYNTISANTSRGIWMKAWSNNSTVSNNTITNGTDGILLWWSTGSTISNNTVNTATNAISLWWDTNHCTISNNTVSNSTYWILLSATTYLNTISNNTATANVIWISADWARDNTFTSNTISSNTSYGLYVNGGKGNTFTSNTIWWNTTYGISITNSASGNIFSSNTLNNSNININIVNAHYNQFTNDTIQTWTKWIYLNNSTFNTFDGTTIASNSGMILNAADNNTLKLANNTNGVYLIGGSDNNNILNTQILGQNNIFISNGSNNIITGGLFTTTSTTNTSVTINLKNNQSSPTYEITWAGLSWTYPTTSMTGSTWTVVIELTPTNNEVKNIIVTYNNGNMQYDSITLWTTNSGGWSNGWGGWGGGWGGWSVACTSAQLVCSGGVWTRVSGTSCTSSLIGNACTVGGSWTLPVGSIAGSHYSTELNNAYLWAYANGITTMNTIQKANMWGTLIRSHMAKMISNFAIKFGGLTPDTSKSCTFDDITNQSTEMKFYIKLSCQLGLMGQGITHFDPKGEVTRAQFGTILSRLIRWDMYEWGTKYYTNHLNALKAAGIMTQISNPSQKEIRGYVMLMMMRTYEWGFLND